MSNSQPTESPRGTPVAMTNAVFSRHSNLSEQLRTASSNLQQSLDALGSMATWEPDMTLRSPYTTPKTGNGGTSPTDRTATASPAVSSPTRDSTQASLLIQRIQELETAQQRQLKEQGDLRMQLVEKDEKMRKKLAKQLRKHVEAMQNVVMRDEPLGEDRRGRRFWFFFGDPQRVWVEAPKGQMVERENGKPWAWAYYDTMAHVTALTQSLEGGRGPGCEPQL